MVVVTVTDCPPKLRGDLTKWLIEINTGVYVGRVSARVREEIWKRVCENLPRGRATMVFSAANEQGMAFLVHNTTWQPTDFDGLTLMYRPLPNVASSMPAPARKSKAAINEQIRGIQSARARNKNQQGYVAVDVETTGLDAETDEVIELAAVRIVNHEPMEKLSLLIKAQQPLSEEITKLTGITTQMLATQGVTLAEAMGRFCAFVDESPMVSHNAGLDRMFLNAACSRVSLPVLGNRCVDTLRLARRYLDDVPDFKLSTLAKYFEIETTQAHRALADCMTTYQVYEKLNEI